MWLREVGAWHREYGIRARMSEGEMTRVAVHELGHVLGLGHQMRGCAVMEPSLGLDCTSVRRPWLGLCPDPLEPDDIRGAVALYGGHEPKGGLRLCSLFARPGRPRSVTARPPARSPGETALSWLSPAGITLPRRGYDEYSLSGPASIAQYRVRGSRHGCPRTGGSLVADGGTKPGETIHVRADLAPGAWCLAVQVGDDWGRWGLAATVKVTIAAPQHPPIAAFVAPEQPFVGAGAAFTDRSKPGSAPITQWHWSFGDGTASTVENPTHTYAAAGTYTVRLTVTDANGRSATTRQPVTVIAPVPPQAAFDAPSEVTAGDDVSFEDASIPGTSPIVSWAWSFGDGTASSDENPDHIYATPGTDTATLTVTAQDGRQSSTSETITVDPQDAQVIRNPRSWTVH